MKSYPLPPLISKWRNSELDIISPNDASPVTIHGQTILYSKRRKICFPVTNWWNLLRFRMYIKTSSQGISEIIQSLFTSIYKLHQYKSNLLYIHYWFCQCIATVNKLSSKCRVLIKEPYTREWPTFCRRPCIWHWSKSSISDVFKTVILYYYLGIDFNCKYMGQICVKTIIK